MAHIVRLDKYLMRHADVTPEAIGKKRDVL
jgi:hypothetical protein